MPGDFATLEADGTITLLGRGSVSINSGGEKIFPEEVESAVRHHPEVYDCVVVGVPDERWGRARRRGGPAATGRDAPTSTPSRSSAASTSPATSCPREIHYVDRIERSPSGKPDYRWAKAVATGESAPT